MKIPKAKGFEKRPNFPNLALKRPIWQPWFPVFVAVNSSDIREARRRHCIRSHELWRNIRKATRRKNGTFLHFPPTTAHTCESRATRRLAKPQAVGTRLCHSIF
ncbi:hypothetical protein AVEN_26451-1 [Araneus ventricosus]|uniref:Uncharacterized protein n=1 Tax=Araneus ventricosus TaxID=182803 RepID=A0A4Y2G0K5_ARAVE|nr:hypothetical protein AVEN_26451-1 [Araneus ventricosus]